MVKIKKIIIYICVLVIIAQKIDAAVVSDNDGSSFITHAEFDSLKNDFQSQIDFYNTSIDSKIDSAIDSYLSGVQTEKTGVFNNVYSNWKCGTDFKWGNNTGYKTSNVLGGGSTDIFVNDIRTYKFTQMSYSNTVTNNIFLATGTSSTGSSIKIYLKPRQHVCIMNEVALVSFAESSTSTGQDLVYRNQVGGGTGSLSPSRNGVVKSHVKRTYGTYPSSRKWEQFVTERISTLDTLCSVFSPNRTLNEYYVKEDGDESAVVTINTIEATQGIKTGDYGVTNNQSMTKTVTLGWQKYTKHNELIIEEWSKNTGKEEKIKTGAPVAHITENDCEVTITYSTDKAGKFYIYSSASPKAYSDLVSNNYTQIVDVSSAVAGKKVVLKKCSRGEVIRAIFIPTSGTGVLSISEIKYKLNS